MRRWCSCFFQICNAKIRSLDGLRSYAFAIARNIIAGQMRYAIPLSPALCQSEEVDDVTNIDQAGVRTAFCQS